MTCQFAAANAGRRSRFIENPRVVLYCSPRVANSPKEKHNMTWFILCLATGTGLGAAFDQVAIGVAIGIILGRGFAFIRR